EVRRINFKQLGFMKKLMGNQSQYSIHGIILSPRPIHIPEATIESRMRARELRKNGILSEVVFWRLVKKSTFHGIQIDRQRCIGPFIVDFYIRSFGVAIELDGVSHIGKYEYDRKRDEYLIRMGIYIIHIESKLVITNPDIIIRYLEMKMIERFGV
ncbi:MAG: endonuclease domain-containing protein, partial [Ignavibacteria bacterium]